MKEEPGGKKPKISLTLCLNLSIGVVMVLVSIFLVESNRRQAREAALQEAEEKAQIILDRNLATHIYFAKNLKPAVYALSDPYRAADYFEPSWMSSTFAVREIDKYFKSLGQGGYYYKESAINARSPENEADDFEKAFLQDLKADPQLKNRSLIRQIADEYYFVTLRRGEVMEESCLRCHNGPENAPQGLIDAYGPDRSFGRRAGELVSAISIRVPLSKAYASADANSRQMSIVLVVSFLFLMLVQFLVSRFFIINPLGLIRRKAVQISECDEHLGEEIPLPLTHDLRGMAQAFNRMSKRLRNHVDNLEKTVAERTSALNTSNQEYSSLFNKMLDGFAHHEIICDAAGQPIDYRFLAVNPSFEELTGLKAENLIGRTVLEVLPGTEKHWIDTYGKVALSGEPVNFENYSVELDRYFLVSAYRPAAYQFACIFQDVTAAKKAAAEREKLIDELQKALKEIKTLRGIVPICSYCKKIRDDQGSWSQLEKYVHEHSEAEFSHGICPECYAKEMRKIEEED